MTQPAWNMDVPDLAEQGAELIANWFAERYPGESAAPSEAHLAKVGNCVRAHSSAKAFQQYDTYARMITELLGCADLHGKRGAILGCDWGVSAVHFGETQGVEQLHAVDLSGNYGSVAQSLLAKRQNSAAPISIRLGPLEEFTNSGEIYDFIIITRSLTFSDTASGRARLAAVLDRLASGGVILLYPQERPGLLTMEKLAAYLAASGFGEPRSFDHSGRSKIAELIRTAFGKPVASSIYLAARRMDGRILAQPGSNAAREIWLSGARQAITRWYEDSDYVKVANIRGGNARTMVNDTITSFCSERALSNFDRIISLMLERTGWDNLQGRAGMLFGCDWGFNVLHIASEWQPERMVGVDITGKYGKAARKILSDEAGLFEGVEVIDAGPGRMSKYAGQMDFLIVTKSFTLLDNGFDRQELLRVLQVLKPGGYLIFSPDFRPGLIQPADFPGLLQAAGVENAATLNWSGQETIGPEDKSIHFVVGQKAAALKTSEIGEALKSIGQDAESILARRPALNYGQEDIVTRCQRIRRNIEGGSAVLDTLPLRYTMNMLSVCNIKCIFCDYPDRLRHWSLPETFLGDVLDTLDGTLRVQITGGETMMSPSALDMLSRARETPYLQLEVITNMTIEKPGLMERVARGASFVTCSIDAATKETYDIIRQDSNFERVVRNLKELVQLRNRLGLHYPHVQINFIIMGHNPHEVHQFVDLAKEIGADSVAYKWLLWTLTPRITEAARFDFSNDRMVRTLCENLIAARDKSIEHNIRIVWGPVPYHIKHERPDLYEEYGLKDVFADGTVRWTDPKRIFAQQPRAETKASFKPEMLDAEIESVDEMPDGLMPCTAPFTTMQINGPRNANFCCYSTAEYRAIPIDATGSLLNAWNHPKFVEARQHFIDGKYAKVCRPHCSLYREHLERKKGARSKSQAELSLAKEASMSADAEWDPATQSD